MVLRLTVAAVTMVAVALSGCVSQNGPLSLQDVEAPEFATVFVQSEDDQPRMLRIDVFEDDALVASKVYHTPGTGLAREMAASLEVDLERLSVQVFLEGVKIGSTDGPDKPCRMGEAFVDVVLEPVSVSSRCI